MPTPNNSSPLTPGSGKLSQGNGPRRATRPTTASSDVLGQETSPEQVETPQEGRGATAATVQAETAETMPQNEPADEALSAGPAVTADEQDGDEPDGYWGEDGWFYTPDHLRLGFYDEDEQWHEHDPAVHGPADGSQDHVYFPPADEDPGVPPATMTVDPQPDYEPTDFAPTPEPAHDPTEATPEPAPQDEPPVVEDPVMSHSTQQSAPTFTNYEDKTRRKIVPTRGWQATVHRLTGGLITPAPSKEERQEREWLASIDQRVRGAHRVTFNDHKGGVGKTTTTIATGVVFAMHNRRGNTIAIDANPDVGTLAMRAGQTNPRTVRDLINNLPNVHTLNDLREHLTTTDSRLEVLASDTDPEKAKAFSPGEYEAVLGLFEQWRQIILTDTGTDLSTPLMQTIMDHTDTLVVPTTTAHDGALLGWQTLDTWEKRGPHGERLVQNSIVAIIQSAEEKQVPLDELVDLYSKRVRTVIVVPRDKHLAAGSAFDWDSLAPSTQRAYYQLAAAISEDFRH